MFTSTIQCRECGQSFEHRERGYRRPVVCPVCSNNRSNIRRRKLAAEARAGMTCHYCHSPLAAARSTRLYCSDTCRKYAYIQRRHLATMVERLGVEAKR
jgi:hypothetical protein